MHNSLLSDLCTASGNDIRSCLNSLQFAAMKALVSALGAQQQDENGSKSIKKDITSTLMNMMKGGLNDKQKDVFSIWKEIFNTSDFNKQRAFKQKLANESGSSMESSGAAVYEILSTLVNESGDSNLILSGVHENLPKARFNDPVSNLYHFCCVPVLLDHIIMYLLALLFNQDMSRLLVSMEWLSFTDYVEQFARYDLLILFNSCTITHFLTEQNFIGWLSSHGLCSGLCSSRAFVLRSRKSE